ncbi:MAG: glycosyltransferase family 4 protein, partial [Clostridia bacterium]|nr:glycosyltransferase family 4 protein [Clostridia bacterium]
VSKWVYKKADILIYSSKRFQGYLKEVHNITVPDEHYMPQFADEVFEEALPTRESKPEKQLVFAGNIGKVQAVEVLIEAAAILRDEPVHWHIVGEGSNYESCMELAKSLDLDEKITFYGRKPLSDMPIYYGMADAMLVSMKNDLSVNDTLPGKVQSYMAAGKPILGSIAGETPYVINKAQCGLCAPPDDPEAFAEVVRQFLAVQDADGMGERGKAYYTQHFTKQKHMDKLEKMLFELAGGK